MGLSVTKIVNKPNMAVNYLKKNMIEDLNSIKIEMVGYDIDFIKRKVNANFNQIDRKLILYVLDDNEFNDNAQPEFLKDIHFIDSNCNSILHIINKSGVNPSSILTINMDVLRNHF